MALGLPPWSPRCCSPIYKFDRGGFNKTQYAILWTAGLSYRFGH